MIAEVVDLTKEGPLQDNIGRVAQILVEGGTVIHSGFVYIGRKPVIGFEVLSESLPRQLLKISAKSVDTSKIPQGEMPGVELDVKTPKNSPFNNDNLLQGMALLIQYMVQKAYMKQDDRIQEAEKNFSNQKIKGRKIG